jgi:glycosyltransferase involved in cell wall biosynthesis
MSTISLCMIVKNEEKLLARCLDSVSDLMDEIIIVDTGSTDDTKKVAARYTDKIFDFKWVDDFSAARNYAFSKATMDYIYSCDADEILDSDNHEEFRKLKAVLIPEVEIVQMKYSEIASEQTVLNSKNEYRPKLFKRLRNYVWINPVHETVRLDPVVFDSDIVIMHRPDKTEEHSKRDFRIFSGMVKRGEKISDPLLNMYARELWKKGSKEDFKTASRYFKEIINKESVDPDCLEIAAVIMTRASRLLKRTSDFIKYTSMLQSVGLGGSELFYELGEFFYDSEEYEDALVWYRSAVNVDAPVLDVHAGGDEAYRRIVDCCKMLLEDSDITAKNRKIYKELQTEAETAAQNWNEPEVL